MRDKFNKALKKIKNLPEKVPAALQRLPELKKQGDIEEVDVEFMTDTSAAMLQGVPIRYHLILIVSAVKRIILARSAAICVSFSFNDETNLVSSIIINT